jgi:RNA polymerase sigma-70 factor (ECF subfamily)
MNGLDLTDTVRPVHQLRPERHFSMEKTRLIENDDISSLLERAKNGDRAAFKAVISLYQRKVFLLAYSMLRNREDALDVVQETFMRLYQKLDAYERQKNFQGWLLQIAKNLCIDYYRKHNSRRREMGSDKPIDDLKIAASDPESNPVSSEVRQVFLRSLDKLGDRQRTVFMMKHYNGLEYREIAQVLRISVGTVKSLHFKAVRNLRQLMGPQLGVSI